MNWIKEMFVVNGPDLEVKVRRLKTAANSDGIHLLHLTSFLVSFEGPSSKEQAKAQIAKITFQVKASKCSKSFTNRPKNAQGACLNSFVLLVGSVT